MIKREQTGDRECDFSVPPRYYRVYREGDIVLRHPALTHTADLSNPSLTVCMICGEMQSAIEKRCHGCGVQLFSVTLLNSDDSNDGKEK